MELRRSSGRAPLRFFAFAAALGLAGAAPFLANCSSSDTPAGAAASAVSPLTFLYDEAAKRIRVKVTPSSIDDQTTVVMRLRKGTLTVTSLDELDCASVQKNGVTVPLKGSVASGDAGAPSFGGPAVDDAFLDQFYERETIGPDATQAQLTAIRAGTDPIVEGCVMRAGSVVGKAQISVFRAWDNATPDLLDRVQRVEASDTFTDPKAVMHGVGAYGELCERELGEIPFFRRADGSFTTYDCTTGAGSVQVPITVTGSDGKAVEQTTEPDKCDKPDWLRRSCQPYARIQHAVNDQGTDWVLICRKPPVGQKKADTTFYDQGLIGHNPKTGKTCFFQNGLYGKADGAHVASPSDPLRAEATWSSFDVSTCHSCHDNDAFAHTPWVDQAKTSDGAFVVPRIGATAGYPMNNAAPYSLVAMRSKNWQMRDQLVSPEAAACTTCHRIVEGNTMTGEQTGASWTERSVGLDTTFQKTRVSDGFQAFANTHWMPPTLGTLDDASWSKSAFGQAVQFIRGCSTSKTCQYASIPKK